MGRFDAYRDDVCSLRCDLHIHSVYSDGTYTPSEIVAEAKRLGLIVALTDHNTAAGLPEFMDAAQKRGVTAVPGVEFSTEYKGKELIMHGSLTTYRISVTIHPHITLCLDENHYLGKVDRELEIEYDEGYHAEAWKWLMLISMILNKGRNRFEHYFL